MHLADWDELKVPPSWCISIARRFYVRGPDFFRWFVILEGLIIMQTSVCHSYASGQNEGQESIEKRIKTEEMGEYKESPRPMEKVVDAQPKENLHPQTLAGYVFVDMVC
jgi:hypothetical protein